jgi:hypothetical protein
MRYVPAVAEALLRGSRACIRYKKGNPVWSVKGATKPGVICEGSFCSLRVKGFDDETRAAIMTARGHRDINNRAFVWFY